jgi:hypothetical protein
VGGRSLSISESEVIAEDDAMDGDRLIGFFVFDCICDTLILLLLLFSFCVPEISEVDIVVFRRVRLKDRDMWYTGAKRE